MLLVFDKREVDVPYVFSTAGFSGHKESNTRTKCILFRKTILNDILSCGVGDVLNYAALIWGFGKHKGLFERTLTFFVLVNL